MRHRLVEAHPRARSVRVRALEPPHAILRAALVTFAGAQSRSMVHRNKPPHAVLRAALVTSAGAQSRSMAHRDKTLAGPAAFRGLKP